ncbi:MAG: hypothetical protein SD837_10360 [Candidatus Electrothrix scaldis]|nr:MAG: hypothetical protein SD837_10360 [Candidatus Electrothrix sp. GW3-3]
MHPISGRYLGRITNSATHGDLEMDLRIDIDRLRERSLTCNCISWDLIQQFEEEIAGRICRWQVDRGSWILQAPKVSEDGLQIHGTDGCEEQE